MKTKKLLINVIIIIAAFVLSGCAGAQKAKINTADVVNIKTSDYYPPNQPTTKNKRVFVFVHGIFGDAYESWQNDNNTFFFELLKKDKSGVFTGSDVFVFGYTSDFLGSSSFTPDEASDRLATTMRFKKVTDHEQIIFVAHSGMGGLVILKYLLHNPEVAAKVPLVFFYSTPQSGVDIL